MIENIVLGIAQGIGEWIPISSEGLIVFLKTHVFHSQDPLNVIINYALFLHLGTLFAAAFYFRKELRQAFTAALHYNDSPPEDQKLLIFLTLTTLISGSLGLVLVKTISRMILQAQTAMNAIMWLIAACLIITGIMQFKAKPKGFRTPGDLKISDGILLGLTQALTTLPGLSRSGTTIAVLLFRGFEKSATLKLSFLMSMPLIFLGNILLNIKHFTRLGHAWVGALVAFVVGIVSIDAVIKIAKKINFGAFLIFIGAVMILATLW